MSPKWALALRGACLICAEPDPTVSYFWTGEGVIVAGSRYGFHSYIACAPGPPF